MILKYDVDMDNKIIKVNLKRLTNQIYKLLPNREEGINWEKPLETIIEEIAGMDRLFLDNNKPIFLTLLCKLEGLFNLTDESNFSLYRRTIFECIGLIGSLSEKCLD